MKTKIYCDIADLKTIKIFNKKSDMEHYLSIPINRIKK